MRGRRILAILLALVFAGSLVLGIPVISAAEEIKLTDAYVLHYTDGKPYYYGSLYNLKHTYYDADTGDRREYDSSPVIFNLEYGDGDRTVRIPVYCTDANTTTRSNTTYRRINLEDSTFYPDGSAARLRAVVMHSFPYLTVEKVAQAVNATGENQVTDLTQGELLNATQAAIWKIAHGDKYTLRSYFTGMGSIAWYDLSEFVEPDSLRECVQGANTESNIKAVYDYLLSLDGMEPLYDAVSEYTFDNVVYSAVKQEDGTYTITVTYEINTQIGAQDELTFRATCGDVVQSGKLTTGKGKVVFENVKERENVVLEINGYQCGGDVYLFDSVGDRNNAQSMIGYDDTKLPVHGEVIASPDRVINIYKTTSEEPYTRLENVVFDIYQVATMEELESGKVTLHEKPTADEIEAYQTEERLIVTLTTDANGYATYNLTENGMPDGVYMVVEREHPAIIQVIEPFFVAIPGTATDGSSRIYTINIYPKNLTETGPDIKKDVTQIGKESDTFDVNEIHTWIIRGGVPAGIGDAKKYEITDTLDYRLTYKGDLTVKVGLATDQAWQERVTLLPDTDYTLTVGRTQDVSGNDVDTFKVSLTADGMKKVASTVGTGDPKEHEIRIYFNAVIDNDAQMGVQIPNEAALEYTNAMGLTYDETSDIPEVHTGGIGIWKVDSRKTDDGSCKSLAGATFRVARLATEEEIATGEFKKLTVDGVTLNVVFVSFYDNESLTGEKVMEATSDEAGNVTVYGLAYGTYYLVETKAPEGYQLLKSPVQVQIDAESHTQERIITVVNSKFDLPQTGGMGTMLFTVVGMACVGGAAALVLTGRKKRT